MYYYSWSSGYPEHGDCAEQRQFLTWAKERYHQKLYQRIEEHVRKGRWGLKEYYKVGICYPYWFGRKEQLIQWLYKWGRDYQICFIDYFQFRRWILDQDRTKTHSRIYRHRSRYSYWDRSRSGEDGFRQIGYLKKEYNQKEQWRIDNGHYRDKSKAGSWRSKPPGKWVKKYCNSKHRQWERRNIHHKRYDALSDYKNKKIYDPWMWS